MIKEITIKNFKSIQCDTVHLEPLNVIVGANGAGKSNFIKAIEFIGLIPDNGLSPVVNKSGGFNSIIPKAYAKKDITKEKILISIKSLINLPIRNNRSASKAFVEYCLEIRKPSYEDSIRVLREFVSFQNADNNSDDLSPEIKLEIERGPRGGRKYLYSESFFDKDSELNEFKIVMRRRGEKLSKDDLKHFFNALTRKEDLESYESLLQTLLFNWYTPANIFKESLQNTRRFDLLLSNLRSEQPQGNLRRLSSHGDNLASVLRGLKSNSDYDVAMRRIINTMSRIAPNVAEIRTNSLRTGKEFVEFIELGAKSSVESWESSDGILRTLAILLALETQPKSSLLLIEEPEQNLHPWAIKAIIDHMREVIKKKQIQVVLTTHSQQVLECVNPNEVLFARRDPETGTNFRTLEQIYPDRNLVMGDIGRLWVKGLLGGVPADEQN